MLGYQSGKVSLQENVGGDNQGWLAIKVIAVQAQRATSAQRRRIPEPRYVYA